MLQYIIQTILFQLIFLAAYDLFHKKDTFFAVNRVYLLVTSLLSLIVPFMKVKSIQETIPDNYIVDLPTVFIGKEIINTDVIEVASSASTMLMDINWWLVLYVTGILITISIFIRKIIIIYSLTRKSTNEIIDTHPTRVLPNSKDAFTFWNTIYLGDQLSDTEKKQILVHELVHHKQKHTLDLIWFEIIKIIFWFNPLVYIYHFRVIALHEYISDASAIKVIGKSAYYERLLNANFQTKNVKFANNFFNHKLLKKRIIMLQKTKSSTTAKLKYLSVVPLLVVMVTFTAFSQKAMTLADISSEKISDEIKEITDSFSSEKTYDNITNEIKETTNSFSSEKFYNNNATQEKAMVSATSSAVAEKKEQNVPFAVVEKVPTTKNCAHLTDRDKSKKCVSDEIKQFVNKNYNINIAKSLGLTGINRVFVRFKIDISGNITQVEARGPAIELEEEANRVISSLPQMIPGEHKGEKVNVLYSLPIVFHVDHNHNTDTEIEKNNKVQDENVITDSLSYVGGHDIKNGYYLVTNIFKRKSYADKGIKVLKKKGLKPKSFLNPKDMNTYVYLERYNSLEEAKKMLLSDFDGGYEGDMYILKIQ